jgi:hypothetical protein
MFSFDSVKEHYNMKELTPEQVYAVAKRLDEMGRGKPSRVAYAYDKILIEGGRWDYYVGLEYCKHLVEASSGSCTLYNVPYEDTQVDWVVEAIERVE